MATTLGALNPFRYRGYVYDEETSLYYLRSRYYNPDWGRFLNADSVLGKPGKLLGHNVFAYCGNNPVCKYDSNGLQTMWVYNLSQEPEILNAYNDLEPLVSLLRYPPRMDAELALVKIEGNLPYIHETSSLTGIPVEMIEAVLFREIICYGFEDKLFDWRPNGSKGIAQIKVATARMADEAIFPNHHWPDSKYEELLSQEPFNILICGMVMKNIVNELGFDTTSLSSSQIQKVFSAYNAGYRDFNVNSSYAIATMSYYNAFRRFPTKFTFH